MSEKIEKKIEEDVAAFKLIQHFSMKGEDTYESFQTRIQALKLIALKLDLLKKLELRVSEQDEEIKTLNEEILRLKAESSVSPEVKKDFNNVK